MKLDGAHVSCSPARPAASGRRSRAALAARGAALILTGGAPTCSSRSAAETGGRVIVSDLAEPDAPRSCSPRRGERRRARRQRRRCPAAGGCDSFTRRGDRPRARRQPARADAARAGCWPSAMVARGSGHLRVHVLARRARPARPAASVYSATKFGLRGFALALREDLRAAGVGVSRRLPRLHPRRGDVPDSGAKLPPCVGTSTPEEVADAVVQRDRARPRRARRRAAAACARAWSLASVAPGLAGAVQRRLGATADRPSRSSAASSTSARAAAARARSELRRSACASSRARPSVARRHAARRVARRLGADRGQHLVGQPRAVGAATRRGLDADDDLVAVDLLERDRAARRGRASGRSRSSRRWTSLGVTPGRSRARRSHRRARAAARPRR